MKIIGGHDYYDKGMMYGIDDTVLLIRNNETLKDFHYFPPMCQLPKNYNYREPNWTHVFVIIADKLYSGISYDPKHMFKEAHIVWDFGSYIKLLNKLGLDVPRHRGWYMGNQHITALDYFNVRDVDDHIKAKMLDNKWSILSGEAQYNMVWTANTDNLKHLKFYKAVDAFTLYQTLDMWVSGVLAGSGNKTVDIKDDKIKIQKHGFDLKASFRKRKE